jgi:hypothetical protein
VAPYDFPLPADGETVVNLLEAVPDLEEIYLFAHGVDTRVLFALPTLHRVRILQVYHASDYPLAVLAANPAAGNLRQLLCHPHATHWNGSYLTLPDVRALVRSPYLTKIEHLQLRLSDMGDTGAREIAASGILKRLKVLDLRHGCITDAGARTLAACPELRHLELLDVQRNRLTAEGVAVLQATGVPVRADNQHEPGEDGAHRDDYLYEGDVE